MVGFVPGSNLLRITLRAIKRQKVTYYQALERIVNNIGVYETFFAAPVTIIGSFQTVPRNMYTEKGLDFNRDYYIFYTTTEIIDIQRDVTNDRLAFEGNLYQCEANNTWIGVDGWLGVICCRLKANWIDQPVWGFNTSPTDSPNSNFFNGNFLEVVN